MTRPGPVWTALLGLCISLVVLGGIAWTYQIERGIGVSIKTNPAGWTMYITTFVFWVGIAHSGTLISAILFLLRARWRTSIFRSAEAMTVFAVMTAGLFPLIHLGRVWRFYYLFPYPNQRELWPNFKSPLIWDVFAISTYFTISAVFFLVGMIPDLAVIRDRAKGWRRKIYTVLSFGWRGSDREWTSYLSAYVLFAGLATPLVVSVHSVVSWDFAMSIVPGWHSTIFAPYFVAGAIHSGLAMVLTLLIPLRRVLKCEDIITLRHVDAMAKVVIFTGLIVGYAYALEFFLAWYSGNQPEYDQFVYRATGDIAWMFWAMVAFNAAVPLALFWRKVRRNLALLFLISILINVGMWFERFVIIVSSLSHEFLPHGWGGVSLFGAGEFHWVDLAILAGSFGWFFMWFLLFVKTLPWIAVTEVREGMHRPDEAGGGTAAGGAA
ncbi:MAG: polysulfide reductase NrfD [Deltaproteobacteria bacterium]|nr:polysulfide reductase NrfD [Deltaproteobacteria bacterium]